jgi:hypothetical protein
VGTSILVRVFCIFFLLIFLKKASFDFESRKVGQTRYVKAGTSRAAAGDRSRGVDGGALTKMKKF